VRSMVSRFMKHKANGRQELDILDCQCTSLLPIRSRLLYRLAIRLVRPQTLDRRWDFLSRLGILHAQSVYAVLPVLLGSRYLDRMGK
jgi:hypothetical protein